ncbi:hypothetical protein [Pseudomonas viridiflava]|uniref:hypothetical protein n=1 Tax=Pseudomonas viridiflava TaxID=33069 RepID=UPI000F0737EF|nr:hypothetical protein [Pseudomonas viridiflava]
MNNERLRIPMDPGYAEALGLAIFAFARLEWDVIWCCERLERDLIHKIGRMTARNIGDKFASLARQVADESLRAELHKSAERFLELVEVRNSIVHGNPATDEDGGQRLFRHGSPWTIERLSAAADDFTLCSSVFNAFLYRPLQVAEQ